MNAVQLMRLKSPQWFFLHKQNLGAKRVSFRAGFTLVELLVASTLIAVVTLIAWSGLISLMNLSATAEAKTFRKMEVNQALDFLTQELRTARFVNATASVQVDGSTTQITDLLAAEGFDLNDLGNYGDLALYLEIPASSTAPALCPANGPNAGNAPPTPNDFDRVIYDVRPSSSEWLGPRTLMRYGRIRARGGSFNPCDSPRASDPIVDALSDNTSQTPTCAGAVTGGAGFYTCQDRDRTQLIFQHTLVDASVTDTSSSVAPRIQSVQPNQLENVGCQNEASLRSKTSDVPATITFVNQRSSAVKLYWLDSVGDRILYQVLNPSSPPYLQPTFLSHPWVVTDTNDVCLGIFMPDQAAGQVTSTDDEQNIDEQNILVSDDDDDD